MDDVNGDEEDIGAKLTAAMEDEKSAAALRELRRTDSADNTPAGANEDDMIMCTVKAGKEYVETIEVDGIEWISWAFEVHSKDVGFFATFTPHETIGEGISGASFTAAEPSAAAEPIAEIDRSEGGRLAQQLIAPWARFTKGEIHRGEWLPTHLRGEIRFVFDNSYSRLRSKQVKFEVKRGGTDRPPELGPLPPTQLTPPASPAGKKGKNGRSPTRTMPASAAASPAPTRPPGRFPASRERQRKNTDKDTTAPVEETKDVDAVTDDDKL